MSLEPWIVCIRAQTPSHAVFFPRGNAFVCEADGSRCLQQVCLPSCCMSRQYIFHTHGQNRNGQQNLSYSCEREKKTGDLKQGHHIWLSLTMCLCVFGLSHNVCMFCIRVHTCVGVRMPVLAVSQRYAFLICMFALASLLLRARVVARPRAVACSRVSLC